jgi:hypothetical protein
MIVVAESISDTLQLGMVAVQSVVGTSSNRAISRELERYNQWRTEVRGPTIVLIPKQVTLFVYQTITRSKVTLKFMIGEHRYGRGVFLGIGLMLCLESQNHGPLQFQHRYTPSCRLFSRRRP